MNVKKGDTSKGNQEKPAMADKIGAQSPSPSADSSNPNCMSTPAPIQNNNEPTGLFGFIQSRKKSFTGTSVPNPNHAIESLPRIHSSRMKYHKLANAGASNYLMDTMSDDSDDEESLIGRLNTTRRPHTLDTTSIDADRSSGVSWFDTLHKGATNENDAVKEKIGKEESSSWMNQAWKIAEDATKNATDWIFPTSSGSGKTNDRIIYSAQGWILPTLSSYVPSINWSPFSENNTGTTSASSVRDVTDQRNTMAFLPQMASRFEFARNGRNPYQAVIGRDMDYLLSSNTTYFWAMSSGHSWLSWLKSNTLKLIDSEENDTRQKAIKRPNSQPSEASIQAVKNLLFLVQNQVNLPKTSALERRPTYSSHPSSESSLDAPFHHNLLEGFPNIHLQSKETTDLTNEPATPAFESNSSFDYDDSKNATSPQSSPVRSSPVRASPKPPRNEERVSPSYLPSALTNIGNECIDVEDRDHSSPSSNYAVNAEMASRLAEGTLRAYRDLVLDEAAELHSALHFWTLRWERPFLAWLEAGPSVWMSRAGHSPYEAARKMSQIQAVLARRCASIGEMQQHLWRASWTKGVADWGMLGTLTGGEWVAVVGGDGGMDDMGFSERNKTRRRSIQIFNHPSLVGSNVTNAPGGRIVIDQDAQVVWSIDAMRVVRDQLYRASLGVMALPHTSNWPREAEHFCCDEDDFVNSDESDLPVWAGIYNDIDAARTAADSNLDSFRDKEVLEQRTDRDSRCRGSTSTVITDLQKMSDEVASLLQTIEVSLYQQRSRRLDRLRPPNRLRRDWYVFAIGVPAAMYIGYKLTKEHGGFFLLKQVFLKVADIYRDHVSEPLHSIYQELVKGRLDVTDRKARSDAIESLKRMIYSWLDEYFPKMSIEEKEMRAESMDISLIEKNMEESIKYIYEAPALLRMSLIEMQFIKKELLNALAAMDELMGSNEINMQVAAMTPAVILLVAIRRLFQWLFYSVFRERSSREDIYATVRQTILDIERLLVMRDNPPPPPQSLEWGSRPRHHTNQTIEENSKASTLSTDDLGMLLLHIHECRQIIWQNRRRFRGGLLRNLTEDLAELAGERGPVSLTQQLQIVNRMSRVYLFMKPRSTFITQI
ncbi:hypothetical protein ACHAW6_008773 [Cyclotella cf. meneghiniana]